MGYCELADVVEQNKGRWPLGTIPASSAKQLNASQVGDFIEQTAGVLDGILRSQGYSLPIATTATSALKVLELYNAYGAACLVEQASPTTRPDRSGQSACAMWKEAQKMLREGTIELDAGVDTGADTFPRYAGSPTPIFTLDMEM